MIALLCFSLTLALLLVLWRVPGEAGKQAGLSPLNWWLVVSALLLVPFYQGLGLAAFVRSITGELSITTLLLATFFLVSRLLEQERLLTGRVAGSISCRLAGYRQALLLQRNYLAVTVSVLGCFFYPMSLGVGSVDPYGWGFGSFAFSSALLAVGLLCWLLRAYFLCVLLFAAQAGYALDLLDSDNLWDYLLDPFLWGWACYFCLAGRWKSLSSESSTANV